MVAVADAFDAMTSTRSYRRARPVAAALEELERCAGTQFDPRMVAALVRALGRQGWHTAVTADDERPGAAPTDAALPGARAPAGDAPAPAPVARVHATGTAAAGARARRRGSTRAPPEPDAASGARPAGRRTARAHRTPLHGHRSVRRRRAAHRLPPSAGPCGTASRNAATRSPSGCSSPSGSSPGGAGPGEREPAPLGAAGALAYALLGEERGAADRPRVPQTVAVVVAASLVGCVPHVARGAGPAPTTSRGASSPSPSPPSASNPSTTRAVSGLGWGRDRLRGTAASRCWS